MNWNYKIDLENGALEAFEKSTGIIIPDDLKDIIVNYNAATPEKPLFMAGSAERIFGAVLSFNINETEADSVYTAVDAVSDKSLLPFGIDPFGNYICYHIPDGDVVVWDHEINRFTSTGKSLDKFIASLY